MNFNSVTGRILHLLKVKALRRRDRFSFKDGEMEKAIEKPDVEDLEMQTD